MLFTQTVAIGLFEAAMTRVAWAKSTEASVLLEDKKKKINEICVKTDTPKVIAWNKKKVTFHQLKC